MFQFIFIFCLLHISEVKPSCGAKTKGFCAFIARKSLLNQFRLFFLNFCEVHWRISLK